MKSAKKILLNLLVFLVLIVITFYVVLKDQDMAQIGNVLKDVKLIYVFIAVIFMCIYVLCDSINIRRMLKALKYNVSFFSCIRYSMIGFFFSGITPAASGGQPMQIFYMHRDNLSVAHSTLTLLVNLSCIQIVTISAALISVVFNADHLNGVLGTFFIIGILLNASALALLLIGIFSKRLTKIILNFSIKVMKKLKLKNVESKIEKLTKEMAKYHFSSKYIKNNKKVILKNLLTTYLQFFAFYSVTYWVYKAFGLSGYNIIQVVSLQAVLYGTVSGIPSPGAVGVTEGGFIEIFRMVIPENMIKSAVILNRGIGFYLLMLVSANVVLINLFRRKKAERLENLLEKEHEEQLLEEEKMLKKDE